MTGFIFATMREAKPFITKAGISIDSKISLPYFYKCSIGQKPIILSICGIGIPSAKKCTIELINKYSIQHVYNIGICGMVNDSLCVNEIYSVSKALYWKDDTTQAFPCKPEYIDTMKHVTLATCFEPVFDSELRKKIAFHADMVDMEGAAVAEICNNNSITCTLVKGVSDTANKGDKKTLYENIDSLSNKMTTLIWNTIFKNA